MPNTTPAPPSTKHAREQDKPRDALEPETSNFIFRDIRDIKEIHGELYGDERNRGVGIVDQIENTNKRMDEFDTRLKKLESTPLPSGAG